MKIKRYLLMPLFSVLILTLVGCGGDEDSAKFKGFSDMVQERRELNKNVTKSTKNENLEPARKTSQKVQRKRPVKGTEIVIKGRYSGEVIAHGTAFFNEEGKLINISIEEEY